MPEARTSSEATGSSYLLTTSEQGQTIQVKVTFTDDADNQESLTSAETLAVAAKPNTAATGEPTISGTPQVDETLTADTSAISDEDGLDNVSYQYQWLRDDADIAGQTSSTYELVSADEGRTIKVRVTFSDDAGNAESLISGATTAVLARSAPVDALTASFANMPADHNGENFTFQLTFSENVDAGYARIRNHALTVTGATIDNASRTTQGSNQGWNVEVNPTGNGAVTITLPETTNCSDAGAICTDDSRKLSRSTSATVAGPPAISISDATVQEAEGAVLVFTATLSHASSRTVTVSYATSDGTAVAGSDYTAASGALTFNAGDTSQTVQVTVLTDSEDESQETLTLTLSNPSQATLDDATGTGAIENGESSSGIQEDPPAETPVVLLTASFANVPADHDGGNFTFDLNFSENVNAGYARIRDHAFTVDGATIANAYRQTQGSNQGWHVEVDPTGNGEVSITLPETTDCDDSGAICADDERMLSHATSVRVTGPPAISVSDATVQEAEGAVLVFTATLSHASSRTVTVDYATSDGTAVAGSDYTAASGALTFNAGDTSQTVQVTVLTDSEDEGQETLTLTLSNPSQATLDDASGAGAIENGESSSGTVVNSLPNGLPTVSGTPQVGETLTTDTSNIDDEDGLTNVSYSYQWIRSEDGNADTDIEDATDSTYTLTGGDVGKTIQVKVTFTDDADNQESLTSEATETVAAKPNTAPTGLPTISGTPQVDQTLTADTSPIDDEDGLTNATFEYQWIAGGSDIGGATGSTYTLTASEQGQTIQVRVTFTDDADNEETLTSEATVAVAAAAPASLTAAFHDLPDSHDGSTAFTFRILFSEDVGISYVNMRDDAFSLSEGDVTGARRVDGRNDLWEITVEPDDNSDVGITLPANRSCTTTGAICTREDSPRQLTNSPTATVTGPAEAPPTNTSAAGAPTISGTPQVEQTLTADTSPITDEDGLTNVSYSYQWIAGGSDIAGATGSTYTLTASEQGQTIQVRVTFTDDADNEETLTSEATAEVTAAPAPLTASLPDSRFQSARHNGADDRPQVIVAFSLPVASFEKTTPSVSLTGAAVSSVRRHQEDGLENAWIFFLDSDGDGDIVFSLATGQPCDSGGICTEDGEMLSEGVQVTLPGPEEEAGDDQQTP